MTRHSLAIAVLSWVLWMESVSQVIGTGQDEQKWWTMLGAMETQRDCLMLQSLTLDNLHKKATSLEGAEVPKDYKPLKTTLSSSGVIWILQGQYTTIYKRMTLDCWPGGTDPRR